MDKVKQFLELVRKHHFWILCGLAAFVGLVAWYLSTATLADQFRTDSGKIDKVMGDLKGIQPEPKLNWADDVENQTKAAWEQVDKAWSTLYQQQKEKVFVWPESLGADFVKAIQDVEGTKVELQLPLLERYQDKVRYAVAQLAAMVDAEPPASAAAPPPSVGQMAPEHRVIWSQISDIQQAFEWDHPLSTQIVKQAQEELWVYEALCKIIQQVDEGSSGPHDAPIQQIISMDIAYSAIDGTINGGHGRIQPIPGVSTTTTTTPTTEAPPSDTAPTRPVYTSRGKSDPNGATPSPDGTAPADPDAIWKSFRYVTEKGAAMMAADVDAAAATAEYFLMPFKLVLKMDRRYIDKLLLLCRNSPLPIEVQQVRIDAQTTGTATMAGPVFRGGGGEHRSEADRGERNYSAPVVGGGTQYDRYSTVEIWGVVYLIQPPKRRDSAGSGDSSPPADGAQESTAPPPANAAPAR